MFGKCALPRVGVLTVLVLVSSETVCLFAQADKTSIGSAISNDQTTLKSDFGSKAGVVFNEIGGAVKNAAALRDESSESQEPVSGGDLGGSPVSINCRKMSDCGSDNGSSETGSKDRWYITHFWAAVQGGIGGLIGSLLVFAVRGELHHVVGGAAIVWGRLRKRFSPNVV